MYRVATGSATCQGVLVKRNRVALVTSVSTAMLGAGWAAGVVGTSMAGEETTTADAIGGQTATTDTATGTSATPTQSASPDATATGSPSAAAPAEAAPAEVAPAGVSGTFDGALVKTGEGPFQAEIVVENGTITAVNVLVDGDDRRDSVRINETALPTLQERVLTAQTWDVEGISGATYTVQGFLTSVKDAMTQAGLA
jgi:uncharacterized protein with FMN-binding domain